MIQENNLINNPQSIKEEEGNKKEKVNVKLFKESNDKDNLTLKELKVILILQMTLISINPTCPA